jgi:GAF domain-containing protein
MPEPTPDPAFSAAAIAELQQLLLAGDDVSDFLQQLARLATGMLPGQASCGITIRRDRRPVTVASSDHRASQVDEIQYGHDSGPCLTSLDTGEVIVIDDLATDDRWAEYQMPALSHGVRSSLSLPLDADGTVVGALNFYGTVPRTFGPEEQLAGRRFAEEASRALTLALRLADQTEMSENLRSTLASRAVIDQAIGIIMGQNRCTADEGFELLRTASQNRNMKLRDIAADIVTSVSGRPPASAPRFS